MVKKRRKNLSAMKELLFPFLSRDDPLEGKRQPAPIYLLGKIPRTQEAGELQSTESQRVGRAWATEHMLQMSMHNCKHTHTLSGTHKHKDDGDDRCRHNMDYRKQSYLSYFTLQS